MKFSDSWRPSYKSAGSCRIDFNGTASYAVAESGDIRMRPKSEAVGHQMSTADFVITGPHTRRLATVKTQKEAETEEKINFVFLSKRMKPPVIFGADSIKTISCSSAHNESA